jgi:hypothetical protein
VVLVAGAGETTVVLVTVVVVGGGATASSCSHAPKENAAATKNAISKIPVRFMRDVRA